MSRFWASRIPLCRYKGLFGNNWKTMPGCAGRASASSAVVMFRLGPRMIDNCCSDFSLSLAILNLYKTKAVHLFIHMRVHQGHFAVKQKNHLSISLCCMLGRKSSQSMFRRSASGSCYPQSRAEQEVTTLYNGRAIFTVLTSAVFTQSHAPSYN